HLTTVDVAVAGNDAVRRRAVRAVAVLGQQAELDEGASVEEEVDPLADRELAPLALPGDLVRAAHGEVLLPPSVKLAHLRAVIVCHRAKFYFPVRRSSRSRHRSRNR